MFFTGSGGNGRFSFRRRVEVRLRFPESKPKVDQRPADLLKPVNDFVCFRQRFAELVHFFFFLSYSGVTTGKIGPLRPICF